MFLDWFLFTAVVGRHSNNLKLKSLFLSYLLSCTTFINLGKVKARTYYTAEAEAFLHAANYGLETFGFVHQIGSKYDLI